MRQVIQTGPITPADELRDRLAAAEKRVASVRRSGDIVQLLRDLDRIAELWPELEAQGVDLKPEAGRWDTVQATVHRKAPAIVRELRAAGGFEAVRQREHPEGTEAWWWHLDSAVRDRRRRQLVRGGLTLAVVAVVGVALVLLLRVLFPVDPVVRESLRALDAGDAIMNESRDLSAALAEYRHAAEVNPAESEAWLRMGAVLEKQGDAPGAADAFARAQTLIGDAANYRVARGNSYLTLGMLDEAEREFDQALAVDADNPYAYYSLASTYELRGDASRAVEMLEKAAQYADEQKLDQLTAMARYRMGMMMQSQRMAVPTPEPTP